MELNVLGTALQACCNRSSNWVFYEMAIGRQFSKIRANPTFLCGVIDR